MKRKTRINCKPQMWLKTVIILARTILLALASMLAFISVHGFGRV